MHQNAAVAGGTHANRDDTSSHAPLRPKAALLAAGITVFIVAWGYLVVAAIGFGTSARSGDDTAWLLLVLACLGAIACLFAGLMLVVQLLAHIRAAATAGDDPPPRVPGGRRAKR